MSRAKKLLKMTEQMVKKVRIASTVGGKESVTVGDESPYALVEPGVGGVDILFVDEKPTDAKEVVAKGPSYGVPITGQDPFYVSLPSKTKKITLESGEYETMLWFDFETQKQRMTTVGSLPSSFSATLTSPLGELKEGESTAWKDISTPDDKEGGGRVFKVSGDKSVAVEKCNECDEFKHTVEA